MLEITRHPWFGDQVALEALARFNDEELKHQELFRRIECLIADGMPPGCEFVPQANGVAQAVMGSSTWAVRALTCHIELIPQVNHRHGMAPDDALSASFNDVFLFHWKEESRHALLGAVDGLLQAQTNADRRYFPRI